MRYILIILLIGLTITLSAQEKSIADSVQQKSIMHQTKGKKLMYDLGSVFGGIGHAYSRPLHWKGKQWKQAAGVLAGTALLVLVDEPVHDFMADAEEDIPQFIQDYGWYYGSPQNNYMLTGGVYLTGLITDNPKLRRTGVLLISSATAAGFLQQTSKFIFGRARPRSGDSPTTFKWFENKKDYHSFPSGHMILSFTNAYAISKQFKNPWVKGGILFLGAVPGISRLWESAHWLSDIALSTAISIVTVEAIDRYLDRRYDEKYNENSKKVSWNLSVRPNQIGVIIQF